MRGNFHKRGNIYQSNIWLLHIRPTHTQVMKQITAKKTCFLTPKQKNTYRLNFNDQRHVKYHFHLWSILTSKILIWNIFLWSTSKVPQPIWAEWGWIRLNHVCYSYLVDIGIWNSHIENRILQRTKCLCLFKLNLSVLIIWDVHLLLPS